MSQVLRKEIRKVLTDWAQNTLTCKGVQNWAKSISTQGADEYAEKVVQHMRGLGEHLITVDDIPTYMKGLDKHPPAAGVAFLEDEGANFDVKARATDLKDDPFYGPHTKAILKELT